MTRPLSLTVVLWVIIAYALESIVGLMQWWAVSVIKQVVNLGRCTPSMAVWCGVVISVIYILLAVLMLRRRAWARVVYVCLMSFVLLGMMVGKQTPGIIATTLAKTVVFTFFLFSREANNYFSASASLPTQLEV